MTNVFIYLKPKSQLFGTKLVFLAFLRQFKFFFQLSNLLNTSLIFLSLFISYQFPFVIVKIEHAGLQYAKNALFACICFFLHVYILAPKRSCPGEGADFGSGEARWRSASPHWAGYSKVWAARLQAGRPENAAGRKTASSIFNAPHSSLTASVTKVSEDLLSHHYHQLRSKPFYPELVQYMTSGPVVVMVRASMIPSASLKWPAFCVMLAHSQRNC